jgi:prophage tail gpP-like protein
VADVHLVVNRRRYGGWKSIRIMRSIESIAGSFELDVSDRWPGQSEPWAIMEEDECRVEIDGVAVIEGYVDRRSISVSAEQRTLSYSGRDRAAALVDCTAILGRYTFRRVNILDLAAEIAGRFGIDVSLQEGLELPSAPAKLVINPGDTAFQALEVVAQSAGVLLVSDGAGGLVLTRAGTARATALVQGQNVLDASVSYDATERFRTYVVATQISGDDDASGDATRIQAEATDEGVRRTDRVLMIRPEGRMPKDLARRRGDWEARIRAARAETVTVTVPGWQQPAGTLWPINALTHVRVPAIGVDGDMLITQTDYVLSDQGELTTLRLVRPDAFTPEPVEAKVKPSGRGKDWKLTKDSSRVQERLDLGVAAAALRDAIQRRLP